jgi:hypothetical protein
VQVDKFANLDIRYGNYFVRESGGMLRVLRERKTEQSPPWPRLPLDPARKSALPSLPLAQPIAVWPIGDWYWATSGRADDRGDILVRLRHKELPSGNGMTNFGSVARRRLGEEYVQDEGDLLIVVRMRPVTAERELQAKKIRDEIGTKTKPAPALVARQWFNTPDGLELDKLRDKVVLLDFFGSIRRNDERLSRPQELYQKYRDRGLVVIGSCGNPVNEDVGECLKEKGCTFPVMIDGGTWERYGIASWPTYVLIDKTGKVVWGYKSDPPTESQIEELLK